MNREELIKEVLEEQHRQHGLVRRKHHGGEARQEHLLHMLRHHPSVNQKDLAERMHVRPQSLGEMLAKLEAGGLVTRKKDPTDGRATLVELTAIGEAAEREHHEQVLKDIARRYDDLSEEELSEYLRLTKKINATLERIQ